MEFTEDGIEAGLETVTAEAEDAGTRADVFLAAKLGVSRSNMQKLLEDGRVKRGEKIIKANYKVRAGEMFVVDIPEPEPIEAAKCLWWIFPNRSRLKPYRKTFRWI